MSSSSAQAQATDEPPRITKLRSWMASIIPCRPAHEREAREELRQMAFGDLLSRYLNWTHRLVPTQPRKVSYAPGFWNSPVAQSHGGRILTIAARIETGEDLKAFLSSRVDDRGYVPRRIRESLSQDDRRWRDKDFVLSVLGVHHLHISSLPNAKGRVPHGDELLFVEFLRHAATFVHAGTHSEFRSGDQLSEKVARMRAGAGRTIKGLEVRSPPSHSRALALAKLGYSTLAAVDGALVPLSMTMRDGTPVFLRRHGNLINMALVSFEPQVDSPDWVQWAFDAVRLRVPSPVQFEWVLSGTALHLAERTSRTLFPPVVPSFR